MLFIKHTVLAAAIMIVLPFAAYGSGVTEGSAPPSFVLMNENGQWVNMDDLIDRATIIYFTHNACHYCTQIIAYLKRAETVFGKKDLRIFGINVMAKDEKLIRMYKEELDFIFPMLAGNRQDVLQAYRINYVPVLVFIDRDAIVRKVVGHYIHEPELHRIIRETMGTKGMVEQ